MFTSGKKAKSDRRRGGDAASFICVHGADAALRPAASAGAGHHGYAHPSGELRHHPAAAGDPGHVVRPQLPHQRLQGPDPPQPQYGLPGGHRQLLLLFVQSGDDLPALRRSVIGPQPLL